MERDYKRMRRVVITGAGVISPVGNTVESFWERIVAGKHGITPITGIDNQTNVKVAAQVHDFDPVSGWTKRKQNDGPLLPVRNCGGYGRP